MNLKLPKTCLLSVFSSVPYTIGQMFVYLIWGDIDLDLGTVLQKRSKTKQKEQVAFKSLKVKSAVKVVFLWVTISI